MKTLISIAVVLIALSLPIFAQTTSGQATDESKGQSYLFFSPGLNASYHIGGGGELFVYKGLGVGGELGGVGESGCFGACVKGVASTHFSYHFWRNAPKRQFEPFVSVGYTIIFRAGTGHLLNTGIGVNRWLNKKVGLRVEGRSFGSYLGFRLGVTFR